LAAICLAFINPFSKTYSLTKKLKIKIDNADLRSRPTESNIFSVLSLASA